MIIELVGAPGAGKSSLQAAAVRQLRLAGHDAMTGDEAVERCLPRSRTARAVEMVVRRRTGRTRALVVYLLHGGGALVGRPRLTARVVRAVLTAPVGWGHRGVLVRRYVAAAGRDRFLRRTLRDGESAVVDEGLAHRAVNLFAWRRALPADEVRGYLRLVDAADVTMVVDASPEAARERLGSRGLPQRLRGRDDATIEAFLTHAHRVVEIAVEQGDGRSRVIRVRNEGTLQEAEAALAATLPQIASDLVSRHDANPDRGCTSTPLYQAPLPIDVPRPDRWIAGRRTVREPILDPFAQVIGELGLRPLAPPRRLPGGRSGALLIPTGVGPIVLKRYKATVDDAAVEAEHSVLQELAGHDFPSPRLIAGPSGRTVVHCDGGRYAAFVLLAGYQAAHRVVALPAAATRLARDAGRALGALHSLLDGFAPAGLNSAGFVGYDGPRVRPLAWHVALLDQVRGAGRENPARAQLDWLERRLRETDAALDASPPSRAVIHGDYGPYNLLVRRGERIVLADFELARVDWRLTDLVTALPRFAANRLGYSQRRASAFMSGYGTCSPMGAQELRQMPLILEYLSLRRAVVCLGREQTAGDSWSREAMAKLRLARELAAGRHPLAAMRLD